MKGKVLVVDDEPIVGELLNFQLSEAGFESVYCDKAKEALRQIGNYQPDIIISDIIMPEMDGYQFHQALRENPASANIPFIFLTARTSTSDELTGLALGVDDYIGKPPVFEILVSRIEKALQQARKTRERNTQALFSGRLGDTGLHGFIQIVTTNSKSGELIFYSLQGNVLGKIGFDAGVLANAEKADLKGEDALYELAAETDGFVEFYQRPIQGPTEIFISSTTALINVEQMLDKRNFLLAQLPHMDVSLSSQDKEMLRTYIERKEPRHAQLLTEVIERQESVRSIINMPAMSPLKVTALLSDLYRQEMVTPSLKGNHTGDRNADPSEGIMAKGLMKELKRLETNMSTGILEIRDLPETAAVYIKNGRIKHVTYGKSVNRKAFYRILTKGAGQPAFRELPDVNKNGMKWTLDFLIEEGVKEIRGMQQINDNAFRYLLKINRQALKQLPTTEINPGMRHILPLVYQHGNIRDIVEASYMTDYQTIKYLHYMAKKGLIRARQPET